MATIPHNIESTRSPFKRYGQPSRSGYSNLGPVCIVGESGSYDVYMSRCPANHEKGIAELFVGGAKSLQEVSDMIKNLRRTWDGGIGYQVMRANEDNPCGYETLPK